MPPSTPDVFDRELDLLFAAADDFNHAESPRPNTPGGKRLSPDDNDNDDRNSGTEDENDDTGNENETGLE